MQKNKSHPPQIKHIIPPYHHSVIFLAMIANPWIERDVWVTTSTNAFSDPCTCRPVSLCWNTSLACDALDSPANHIPEGSVEKSAAIWLAIQNCCHKFQTSGLSFRRTAPAPSTTAPATKKKKKRSLHWVSGSLAEWNCFVQLHSKSKPHPRTIPSRFTEEPNSRTSAPSRSLLKRSESRGGASCLCTTKEAAVKDEGRTRTRAGQSVVRVAGDVLG